MQNEIPEIRMETQQTIFGPVPAQYSLGSISFPVCPVNTETMLVKTGYGSRRNGGFPARFHPYVLMLRFRGRVRRGRRQHDERGQRWRPRELGRGGAMIQIILLIGFE